MEKFLAMQVHFDRLYNNMEENVLWKKPLI
jgi:hypothetical protein